ncbi:MAG: hypothetical protein FJX75_15760 [Armatimonadetes bacterium]|nr:hypothetical protein [Armatimonadota bacterium]
MRRHLAVALPIAVMFFGRLLLLQAGPGNDYYLGLTRRDLVEIGISWAALLVVLAAALAWIQRRHPGAHDSAAYWMLWLSLWGIFDLVVQHVPVPRRAQMLIGVSYPLLGSMLYWLTRIRRAAPRLALALWAPALLLIWVAHPRHALHPREIRNRPLPAREAAPIFFFLFDALTPEAIVEADGKLSKEFPQLATVARDGLVFTNAESPGKLTLYSMTRLLTGREWADIVPARDRLLLRTREGAEMDTSEASSWFSEANQAGYNAVLCGYKLAYVPAFGPHLQYGRDLPLARWYDSAPEYLLVLAGRERRQAWAHVQLAAEIPSLVDSLPPNTLFAFHFPLPHAPLVTEPEGLIPLWRYWWLYFTWQHETRDLYRGQTAFVDRSFGPVLAHLHGTGVYDRALIILAADHPPKETEGYERGRHVPLVIKLPRSTRRGLVRDRAYTINLMRMLTEFMRSAEVDTKTLTTPRPFVEAGARETPVAREGRRR